MIDFVQIGFFGGALSGGPPRDAGAPPRGAIVPPRGAVVPPRGAIVPPRGAVVPPRGAVNPEGGAAGVGFGDDAEGGWAGIEGLGARWGIEGGGEGEGERDEV